MWSILEIEPTADVREIKRAYAALAKKYNPEEHPEEFKRLHNAYRAALRYARSANSETEPESEAADFIPKSDNSANRESADFDFSAVDILPGYKLSAEKRMEKLLSVISKIIDDEEKRNSLPEWRRLFGKEDFDVMYDNAEFRFAAARLFRDELFTPETASLIAGSFGKGSRALPYSGIGAVSRETAELWSVWISGSKTAAPKRGYRLPDYMGTGSGSSFLKSVLLTIGAAAVLFLLAALYMYSENDGSTYSPESSSGDRRVGEINGIIIYEDEDGHYHIADGR